MLHSPGGRECPLQRLVSLVASNRKPFQLTQAKGASLQSRHTHGIGCKPEKGTGNSRNQGSSRDQEEGPDQAQSKLAWTEGTQPQPVSESVALRGDTCEPRLGRACTWLGKAGDGCRPTALALGKGTPAEQHPLQHPANPTPPALPSTRPWCPRSPAGHQAAAYSGDWSMPGSGT